MSPPNSNNRYNIEMITYPYFTTFDDLNSQAYTVGLFITQLKRGCPLTSSEWRHMMKNKIPS